MIRLSLLFIIGLFFAPTCLLAQTDQQTENLRAFTKLYGYVRYFHPSDEAAEVDWDQLAIYGARQVREASDSEALQQVLIELFTPVAPTLAIYPTGESFEFSQDVLIPSDTSDYQTVAWQHLGVYLGERSNVYQSKRTARTSMAPPSPFGYMTSSVEATEHRGKEIKLTALVKMAEGTEGTGHLWLRVDRGREMGFFQNMDDRPITDTAWKTYEIVGTVAPDATSISFGSFLKGKGKLWVDDFQLFAKDSEGIDWQSISLENASFEEEALGDVPWGWYAQTEGYVFQVTDTVAAQGKQSVQISTEESSRYLPLFDQYAEVGQVWEKDIGSGLMCTLPLALYGTSEHTFPEVSEDQFSAFVQELDNGVPNRITGGDLDVRLGNIVITWNVFQHFYPYFDVVSVDWETALIEAFEKAYKDSSAENFLHTLRVLTAKLEDGHVRVSLPSNLSETHFPPVAWEWVEGKLVIVESEHEEVMVGDVVTSIQERPPQVYFDSVYQTISAATQGWRDHRAKEISLAGTSNSTLAVTVETEVGERQMTLTRSVSIQNYYSNFLRKSGQDSIFQEVEGGIFYVNLDQASIALIRERMQELEEANSIIFDLRGYPKGNHEVINHLLSALDTSRAWMQIPQIIYPDQQNIVGYQNEAWGMQPQEPKLDAKIVFITNGRAISYAESFMSFIEHYKLATSVGQPTAGTNGNVNTIPLPGGYQIRWTGMKVVNHDGSQFHGVGILPDVYVEKTIDGVKSGQDEFLKKALEIARKN